MTVPKVPTDDELLGALAIGSEEALATLYQRRQGSIYRFALQMSGSHALAEDVTQEVFMALIRREAAYDPSRGSGRAFLMGIARNQVLRRLHHQKGIVSLEDQPESSIDKLTADNGLLDELARVQTIAAVRRAILTLPEHYREVVILCELQEMSYADAAEILKCAMGTVRSRLHRGRAMLMEKLRPASQESEIRQEAGSARCFA